MFVTKISYLKKVTWFVLDECNLLGFWTLIIVLYWTLKHTEGIKTIVYQ